MTIMSMSELKTMPRTTYLAACRAEAALLRERLNQVTTPALRQKLLEMVNQLESKRPSMDAWL
jgi:hypothetical protein